MSKLSVVGACLLLAGCVAPDGKTEMPWDAIARRADPEPDLPTSAVASAKTVTRVHAIGAKVAAANSTDLAKRPVFITAGVKDPLIFSQNDGKIVVSEGLVDRCTTDDELAAVLCAELGHLASRQTAQDALSELDAGPAPTWTPDVVGGGMAPDMTRLAEQGMMNRRGPGDRRSRRPTGPDPMVLARGYLKKAGYDAEAMQRVEPWLKEAGENAEKRDFMKGR